MDLNDNDLYVGRSTKIRNHLEVGSEDKYVLNAFVHDRYWHDNSAISNDIMATHLDGLNAGWHLDSNCDLVYKGP